MIQYKTLPLTEIELLRPHVVALQNWEQSMDSSKEVGEKIVDLYLKTLKEEITRNTGQIWVAEEDGKIVGFACGWKKEEKDDQVKPFFYLSDLFVDDSQRGKGVGSSLLNLVEQHAKEQGVETLELEALVKNGIACSFYEGKGFEEYQRVLRKRVV